LRRVTGDVCGERDWVGTVPGTGFIEVEFPEGDLGDAVPLFGEGCWDCLSVRDVVIVIGR
jgi:hypothetical protein